MIERPSGAVQTSVLISRHLFDLCKQHNIKFSEALRVGVSLSLADKGLLEYDNNLNLYRKMRIYQQQAMETLAKLTELEEKINGRTKQG